MNRKNANKMFFAFLLLIAVSVCFKNKAVLKILNRVDNELLSSKIHFKINNNIDLSNTYAFIEGDNGDKYIIDLSKDKNIKIDKMYNYEYNDIHNIVPQNYEVIIAKKKDNNYVIENNKSFREISNNFIRLYTGYNIDGEYKLVIPSNIEVKEGKNTDINISLPRMGSENIDINNLKSILNKYTKYNIFTKYYSQLKINNLSICTDVIVRLNSIFGINKNNYVNNIYSSLYIDNNIYTNSRYLSSLINNNPSNYSDIISDIYNTNLNNIHNEYILTGNKNLVSSLKNKTNINISNKIDFNKSFNELNDLSLKLINGISDNNIKFYYVTIDEENNKVYNYIQNINKYTVVNVDCSDYNVVTINNKSNKIIYNFYKYVNGKRVLYDGEVFINNISNSSVVLAPLAFVHGNNSISSNIISNEYIHE